MNSNQYTNVIEGVYTDDADLMAQFSQYKQRISGNFPAIANDLHYVLVVEGEKNCYCFGTYKVTK